MEPNATSVPSSSVSVTAGYLTDDGCRPDAGDVERLYREQIGRAIQLAFLVLGDVAEAEDVAHDAFLRCAGRLGSLRSPEKFGPYLHKTIARAAVDRHRSRSRRNAREEVAAADVLRSQAPALAAGVATAVDVLDALRTLGPEQRAVVVLRYWLDWSEAEIARALRCRPGTVKSRISRAHENLREALDDR